MYTFAYLIIKMELRAIGKSRVLNWVKADPVSSSFINKEIDVVLEETKDGMLFGHSSEYLPIYIQQEHMPASKRMRACVRDYYRDGLIAVEMEEAA